MTRDALDPGPDGTYPYWPRNPDGTIRRGPEPYRQDGVLIDPRPGKPDGTLVEDDVLRANGETP